jgi:hypothetical protein
MAGPSKTMRVSDEVVLYEYVVYSPTSESGYGSDSEIKEKMSSCGEQSVSSDEEESVSDSSVQHGVWAKSGAERPHFPLTGKPGINVYLEDPSNPLEYFGLFRTPEGSTR